LGAILATNPSLLKISKEGYPTKVDTAFELEDSNRMRLELAQWVESLSTLYDMYRSHISESIELNYYGIHNRSNSCYAAAAIQFLLTFPTYIKYLCECISSRRHVRGNELQTTLQNCIREFASVANSAIRLKQNEYFEMVQINVLMDYLEMLGEVVYGSNNKRNQDLQYKPNVQHDVTEYLIYIFDCFDEAIKKNCQKSDSLNMFRIELITVSTCCKCQEQTESPKEEILSLMINVPAKDGIDESTSIGGMIADYLSEEIVDKICHHCVRQCLRCQKISNEIACGEMICDECKANKVTRNVKIKKL